MWAGPPTWGPVRRTVMGTTFAFGLLASGLVSKFIYCVVAAAVPAASAATFPDVGRTASFNIRLWASPGALHVVDRDY